jgi:hypothetical protein
LLCHQHRKKAGVGFWFMLVEAFQNIFLYVIWKGLEDSIMSFGKLLDFGKVTSI